MKDQLGKLKRLIVIKIFNRLTTLLQTIAVFTNQNIFHFVAVNNYSWKIERLSVDCKELEFFWEAQWLINGHWGYVVNNTVESGWMREMKKDQQPLKHIVALRSQYKQCPHGALLITTEWQSTGLLLSQCVSPGVTR